jgi:predicted nucleic acid-binding protein
VLLVDTSVWIDHFRQGVPELRDALVREEVGMHPFVLGEIACGSIRRRAEVLSDLEQLPRIGVAEHEEVMAVLERHRLAGKGLAWIDLHLLASARLNGASLWTRDKGLAAAWQLLQRQ